MEANNDKKTGYWSKFIQFFKVSSLKDLPWGMMILVGAVIWAVVRLIMSILYFFN